MSKTKEVQQQMMAAMKAKDAERKAALSLLLSALKAKAKDKREDLTEEEENAIIQKEIKQTRETMEAAPADRYPALSGDSAPAVWHSCSPERLS